MKQLITPIQQAASGQRALRHLSILATYHRIQASPGYRRAAEQVAGWLREWGLNVEWHEYPARIGTSFWQWPSFQEWWAEDGWLDLIAPESEARRLADWSAVPLSLVPRSVSWEGEAEIVHVSDGTNDDHYEEVDVAGKVVLTKGDLRSVVRKAHPRGAAAYIFYGMRDVKPIAEGSDLPDDIQYTSFWYFHEDDPQTTAFAVTPREGERLATLCENANKGDDSSLPRVRGYVDAWLRDGTFEVVSATIPGEIDDEVLVVSHLCHPAPFANDNTSGAATNLETARVLQQLVDAGTIGPLRRTIRFLWMPEMTGTFAYLHKRADDLSQMICGLNMDMVGENQEQTGSVFLLERPSMAAAGFTSDLVDTIRERIYVDGTGYADQGVFSLTRLGHMPFSGGSDHYVLSDPTVGVDTPMVIQWPDRYYHTTADTVDKVDPGNLAKAATMAGTFAAWIATADADDVAWLAGELDARWRRRLIRDAQQARTAGRENGGNEDDNDGVPDSSRLWFQVDRHIAALERLRRLDPGFSPTPWQHNANSFATQELADFPNEPVSFADELGDAAELVPARTAPGPLTLFSFSPEERATWREFSKDVKHANWLATIAYYWADGHRTLDEIVVATALETGRVEPKFFQKYFELLADSAIITLKGSI